MNITLDRVAFEEKEILRNLMEKYFYEFSQYDEIDINPLGLYGYHWLDEYWRVDKRYPYFIRVDGKLAGFALCGDYTEVYKDADYSVGEFFVLYKYRRLGVGSFAAEKIFTDLPGIWELKCHPKNMPSVLFWEKIIAKVSGGDYTMIKSDELIYDDGTPANLFRFSTAAQPAAKE